jgi:hypothetical protein
LLSRRRAKDAGGGASRRLRKNLGAHFICSEGVAFVDQPEPACAAVKEVIKRIANSGPTASFALAALH